MDTELIETAIRNAVAAGASPAPPLFPAQSTLCDLDLVRAQTQAHTDAFEEYIAELRGDPTLSAFEGDTFATTTTGRDSVRLPFIARLLLAQAISSGDIADTVQRFSAYLDRNRAKALAVMTVTGVTSQEAQLGPDIRLVPLASLPPSIQRGAALGQPYSPLFKGSTPMRSALVREFEYGPIFYRLSKGQGPSAEAHQTVTVAIDSLNQARCLLSLVGTRAAYLQSWVQPKDLLMSAGFDSGTFIGDGNDFGSGIGLDVTAPLEKLATAYFGIDAARRHYALRIPLDRLDRANRMRDLADNSIDLGIALEALLLHDLPGRDRGELRFRLSLRCAWLAGGNPTERASFQKTLRDAYDLRSSAVHEGAIEPSAKNWKTMTDGRDLCRQLIIKVIKANGSVAWDKLVLGEPEAPTAAPQSA
jgi:hypothetical protein